MSDNWHPESPVFTLHTSADGSRSFTVDQWPRQIEVDDIVLNNLDTRIVNRDGDLLVFEVANGRATYCLVERQGLLLAWRAERVSCMLQSPGEPR